MAPSLEDQVSDLIIEARNLTEATKNKIRIFAVVIVFTVVALAGFGATALRANSAATKAQAALVASCESGNDFRRQDLALWMHLLSLPPRPGETPAQRRQREQQSRQFRVFIQAHDKLRVCKR